MFRSHPMLQILLKSYSVIHCSTILLGYTYFSVIFSREQWSKNFKVFYSVHSWRWSVSLRGALWREPGGRAPSLGTPKDIYKRLWRRASLFIGAPLLGNLEEGSSTGDFESWMKGLWRWGIAISRGSVEGASGRAPLPGNLKDEVFERHANALWAGLPLIGALMGEPGGDSFAGIFERNE